MESNGSTARGRTQDLPDRPTNKAQIVLETPLLLEHILSKISPQHTARCRRVSRRLFTTIDESKILMARLFLFSSANRQEWWNIDEASHTIKTIPISEEPDLMNTRASWPFFANSLLVTPSPVLNIFCPTPRCNDEGSPGAHMTLNMPGEKLMSLSPVCSLLRMSLSNPPAKDLTIHWEEWTSEEEELGPLMHQSRIQILNLKDNPCGITLGHIRHEIARHDPFQISIIKMIFHCGVAVPESLVRQVRATGSFEPQPLSLLLTLGSLGCYEVLRSRMKGLRQTPIESESCTAEAISAAENGIMSFLTTKDYANMIQVSRSFGHRMPELQPFDTFRASRATLPLPEYWVTLSGHGITTRILCSEADAPETAFFDLHLADFERQLNRVSGLYSRPLSIKKVVRLNENLAEQTSSGGSITETGEYFLQARLLSTLGAGSDSRGKMFLTMPPTTVQIFTDQAWRNIHTISKSGAMYDDIRFRRDMLDPIPTIRFPMAIVPSSADIMVAATAPRISIQDIYTYYYPFHEDCKTPKWEPFPKAKGSDAPHQRCYRPTLVRKVRTSDKNSGAAFPEVPRVVSTNGYRDSGASPLTGYPGCFRETFEPVSRLKAFYDRAKKRLRGGKELSEDQLRCRDITILRGK